VRPVGEDRTESKGSMMHKDDKEAVLNYQIQDTWDIRDVAEYYTTWIATIQDRRQRWTITRIDSRRTKGSE
jgi:hypothetical protein